MGKRIADQSGNIRSKAVSKMMTGKEKTLNRYPEEPIITVMKNVMPFRAIQMMCTEDRKRKIWVVYEMIECQMNKNTSDLAGSPYCFGAIIQVHECMHRPVELKGHGTWPADILDINCYEMPEVITTEKTINQKLMQCKQKHKAY